MLRLVFLVAAIDSTSSPRLYAAHFCWDSFQLISLEGKGDLGEPVFFGCRRWYEGDLHWTSHLTLSSVLGDGCHGSHFRDADTDLEALLAREHTAGRAGILPTVTPTLPD